MVERSIVVCQVLPVVTLFELSVSRRMTHGRSLLHHGLGEIEELEEQSVADRGAAVYLLAQCRELWAGHASTLPRRA
jgi:hypothetical protein